MRAMDVMTSDVISVDPDTTIQALARLLAERGISGAPVVDWAETSSVSSARVICCTGKKSVPLAGTGCAVALGGSIISHPTSHAITSNRMAARSRTS